MVFAEAPSGTPSLGDVLNSPEMKAFREAWQASEIKEQAEDQAWWDSLNGEERARALRQVAKLIHKAEIKDRGSYRYAMYDIFGIDYCDGMAHYMELHNAIYRGLEAERRACRMDDEDAPDDDTNGQ
jgi:hypothetical protein